MVESPPSSPYGSPTALQGEAGPSSPRSRAGSTPPIDPDLLDESGSTSTERRSRLPSLSRDNGTPGSNLKGKGKAGPTPEQGMMGRRLVLGMPQQESRGDAAGQAGGGKGKDGAEDVEFREEKRETVSERIQRGWETRRAKKRARLERGEKLVHAEAFDHRSSSIHDPTKTPLPTSELLLAIHHRASRLYTAQSLLFPPTKKGRTNPWGSKKRIQLIQDQDQDQDLDSERERALNSVTGTETDIGSGTRDGYGSRNSRPEAGGDGSRHPSGSGSDVDPIRIKQEHMYTDEYGELLRPESREQRHAQPEDGEEETERKRSKGKYKVRDMYRAIDGQGLMAFGVLVQEHIIDTLNKAGYRRPLPKSSIQARSSKSQTQTAFGSESKTKDKAASNARAVSAAEGNDGLGAHEDSEGQGHGQSDDSSGSGDSFIRHQTQRD